LFAVRFWSVVIRLSLVRFLDKDIIMMGFLLFRTLFVFLSLQQLIQCQQYFYTANFGSSNPTGARQPSFSNFGSFASGSSGLPRSEDRNFGNFRNPNVGLSSAGGGSIRSNNAGAGTATLDNSLQAQFREIFDWNRNLSSDPRFQACSVPDIGDVSRACPKRAFYFGLNPQHRRAVGMVKTILTRKDRQNCVS
jgi:hypothetical protein